MSEWFSEWFDSKYYHILYKNRDDREAEVFLSRLMSYLAINKETKVLDLACGKGRHSIYLNSLGYLVRGVDLAANSIAKANQYKNDRLSFGVHDMRAPFTEKNYGLILNVFTSFGYFNNPSDDIKTLGNVKDALTSEGIFVLDFLNTSYLEKNLVATEEKVVDGVHFNLKREIKDKSIIKHINFNVEGKEYNFQERVDALNKDDFESYFKEIGLEIISIFGDYQLNDFDKSNSKRLIFVTKKG